MNFSFLVLFLVPESQSYGLRDAKIEISKSFFKKRLSLADFKKTENIIEKNPEPDDVFSRLERFPKIYENREDKNFRIAHAILSEYENVAVDDSGFENLVENILEAFGKWNEIVADFNPTKLATIVKNVKFGEFILQHYKFIVKKAFTADYLNNYVVDFLDGLKGHCGKLFIPVLVADFQEIIFQERAASNFRSFAKNNLTPSEFHNLQIAVEKGSENFANAVYILELSVFLGSYNFRLEEKLVDNLRSASRADFDFQKISDEKLRSSVEMIYGPAIASDLFKSLFGSSTRAETMKKSAEKEILNCFFFRPMNQVFRQNGGEKRGLVMDLKISVIDQNLIISKQDDENKEEISICSKEKLEGFRIGIWGNEKQLQSQLFEISHTFGSDVLFCEQGCANGSSTILAPGQALQIKGINEGDNNQLVPPLVCEGSCEFALLQRAFKNEHLFQRIIYNFLVLAGYPAADNFDLSVFESDKFYNIPSIFNNDPRIDHLTSDPEFTTMLIFASIFSRFNGTLDFDELYRFLSTVIGAFQGLTADDITFQKYLALMKSLELEVSSSINAKEQANNYCTDQLLISEADIFKIMVILYLQDVDQMRTNYICQSIIQFPFPKESSTRAIHKLLYKTFGAIYGLEFEDFAQLASSITMFSAMKKQAMIEEAKQRDEFSRNQEIYDTTNVIYDEESEEYSEFSSSEILEDYTYFPEEQKQEITEPFTHNQFFVMLKAEEFMKSSDFSKEKALLSLYEYSYEDEEDYESELSDPGGLDFASFLNEKNAPPPTDPPLFSISDPALLGDIQKSGTWGSGEEEDGCAIKIYNNTQLRPTTTGIPLATDLFIPSEWELSMIIQKDSTATSWENIFEITGEDGAFFISIWKSFDPISLEEGIVTCYVDECHHASLEKDQQQILYKYKQIVANGTSIGIISINGEEVKKTTGTVVSTLNVAYLYSSKSGYRPFNGWIRDLLISACDEETEPPPKTGTAIEKNHLLGTFESVQKIWKMDIELKIDGEPLDEAMNIIDVLSHPGYTTTMFTVWLNRGGTSIQICTISECFGKTFELSADRWTTLSLWTKFDGQSLFMNIAIDYEEQLNKMEYVPQIGEIAIMGTSHFTPAPVRYRLFNFNPNIPILPTPCNSSPCLFGGICKSKIDEFDNPDYECDCPTDFAGKNCEIDPCSNIGEEICNFNGQCNVVISEDAVFTECLCDPGYFGPFCNTSPCEQTPCFNGGSCSSDESTGSTSCECPGLYWGQRCENNICDRGLCAVGSVACALDSTKPNGFRCLCAENYSGELCEITPCSDLPCQNGGSCSIKLDEIGNPTGDFTCDCIDDYSGKICERTPCESALNPCNGQTCVMDGGSPRCVCEAPFVGNWCNETVCSSNPCGDYGTCRVTEGMQYECDCEEGHSGLNCQYNACSGSPCLNNGACEILSASYYCICAPGFSGPNCEISPCDAGLLTCSNLGVCFLSYNAFQDIVLPECSCRPGTTGRYCQNTVCDLAPCQNGGECENLEMGEYICSCPGKRCYFFIICRISTYIFKSLSIQSHFVSVYNHQDTFFCNLKK